VDWGKTRLIEQALRDKLIFIISKLIRISEERRTVLLIILLRRHSFRKAYKVLGRFGNSKYPHPKFIHNCVGAGGL